jgi:hypothetical protein
MNNNAEVCRGFKRDSAHKLYKSAVVGVTKIFHFVNSSASLSFSLLINRRLVLGLKRNKILPTMW